MLGVTAVGVSRIFDTVGVAASTGGTMINVGVAIATSIGVASANVGVAAKVGEATGSVGATAGDIGVAVAPRSHSSMLSPILAI